ncbi:MAG TPA: efflux RND transporter periplasmic adaptor subunit [Flavipsychrobacter sp.]|nr:efflux RND transporter periplasmic adaptor subunit [Flavipsychrobacter sp.]
MVKLISRITLVSCLILVSCKHKQPPAPQAVPVNLYTVKAQPVVYYDRYTSTTVALSQVNLLPQVQGYITGIFFKEGTHVKKGQELYEIDRRTYEANLSAAQANLKVAEGNLKQSQQDADRYSFLNSKKAVAKQIYDHAMITLQNSENQVKSAAESVRTAKINLAYSIITAPFDGTIGFSQVKLGNLVTVGQTVLNTISTDDPMGVDFLINEKQLTYFEDLQSGKYKSIDSLFTMILPDGSFYPHQGNLSVIDRAVDPQTGALRIRLVFPNPNYSLRAGMSCVVRVRNQDSTPQMVIPNKAVVEQMGEYFVYIAKDTTISSDTSAYHSGKVKQGLFAFQKKVQPGEVIGPNIIIKEGIKEGDKIVSDGVQSLHDGSSITTANKRPPAQPGKGGR